MPDHAALQRLLPDDLRARIPRLYASEHHPDPTVWLKWFTPDAAWTWYVLEFDGADLCFGLVDGRELELGYFSLAELLAVRGPCGSPVERDIFFEPTPLSQLKARLARATGKIPGE